MVYRNFAVPLLCLFVVTPLVPGSRIRAEAAEALAKSRPAPTAVCPQRAREFVAIYEFLKKLGDGEPVLAAPSTQQSLAEEISSGCDGAARRFINGMQLLGRSGVGGRDRVRLARRLALTDSLHSDAFVEIFRFAFARDGLDLDLGSALALAERVGLGTEEAPTAMPAVVLRTFKDITSFCLRSTAKRGLDLPRPACAQLAADVAQMASSQEDAVLGGKFVEALLFLSQDRSGERLSIDEAIEVLRTIAARTGSSGIDNFRIALRYAAREDGLKLPFRESIRLAERLSGR